MHKKTSTMLKAVRFDLEEHAELIDFVENYRDRKNRPNHSEAIRLLMTKGLENLNNKQPEKEQTTIDIESIKQDIFNQLMSQINSMGISNQQIPIKQQSTQYQTKQHVNEEPKKIITEKEKPMSSPKIDNNPLLANLLSNINR